MTRSTPRGPFPRRTTRRDLLAWSAVLPLAGALVATARAQAKMSKDMAHYQDHPNGDKQCSKCKFFIADQGKCQIVEGDISPNGYCIHFQAR
jgi:hypothetical protein